MSLEGRIAIVTGGGSGIGQAVCLHLGKEGATVVIGDVVSDAGQATATKISSSGGRAIHRDLDVSDPRSVDSFIGWVLRQYQKVDILVNNAGGQFTTTNIIDCKESEWDRTFAVNVKGVFLMSRAVLPSMVQHRSGSIINVGSVAGLVGRKNLVAYSAAKGAIISLTRAMAHDHGRDGIRVNCVCPGPTLTPAFKRSLANCQDPEGRRKAREEEQPLGRLGEPDNIAEAIVFLASDRASWITGAVLPVDGGNSAI